MSGRHGGIAEEAATRSPTLRGLDNYRHQKVPSEIVGGTKPRTVATRTLLPTERGRASQRSYERARPGEGFIDSSSAAAAIAASAVGGQPRSPRHIPSSGDRTSAAGEGNHSSRKSRSPKAPSSTGGSPSGYPREGQNSPLSSTERLSSHGKSRLHRSEDGGSTAGGSRSPRQKQADPDSVERHPDERGNRAVRSPLRDNILQSNDYKDLRSDHSNSISPGGSTRSRRPHRAEVVTTRAQSSLEDLGEARGERRHGGRHHLSLQREDTSCSLSPSPSGHRHRHDRLPPLMTPPSDFISGGRHHESGDPSHVSTKKNVEEHTELFHSSAQGRVDGHEGRPDSKGSTKIDRHDQRRHPRIVDNRHDVYHDRHRSEEHGDARNHPKENDRKHVVDRGESSDRGREPRLSSTTTTSSSRRHVSTRSLDGAIGTDIEKYGDTHGKRRAFSSTARDHLTGESHNADRQVTARVRSSSRRRENTTAVRSDAISSDTVERHSSYRGRGELGSTPTRSRSPRHDRLDIVEGVVGTTGSRTRTRDRGNDELLPRTSSASPTSGDRHSGKLRGATHSQPCNDGRSHDHDGDRRHYHDARHSGGDTGGVIDSRERRHEVRSSTERYADNSEVRHSKSIRIGSSSRSSSGHRHRSGEEESGRFFGEADSATCRAVLAPRPRRHEARSSEGEGFDSISSNRASSRHRHRLREDEIGHQSEGGSESVIMTPVSRERQREAHSPQSKGSAGEGRQNKSIIISSTSSRHKNRSEEDISGQHYRRNTESASNTSGSRERRREAQPLEGKSYDDRGRQSKSINTGGSSTRSRHEHYRGKDWSSLQLKGDSDSVGGTNGGARERRREAHSSQDKSFDGGGRQNEIINMSSSRDSSRRHHRRGEDVNDHHSRGDTDGRMSFGSHERRREVYSSEDRGSDGRDHRSKRISISRSSSNDRRRHPSGDGENDCHSGRDTDSVSRTSVGSCERRRGTHSSEDRGPDGGVRQRKSVSASSGSASSRHRYRSRDEDGRNTRSIDHLLEEKEKLLSHLDLIRGDSSSPARSSHLPSNRGHPGSQKNGRSRTPFPDSSENGFHGVHSTAVDGARGGPDAATRGYRRLQQHHDDHQGSRYHSPSGDDHEINSLVCTSRQRKRDWQKPHSSSMSDLYCHRRQPRSSTNRDSPRSGGAEIDRDGRSQRQQSRGDLVSPPSSHGSSYSSLRIDTFSFGRVGDGGEGSSDPRVRFDFGDADATVSRGREARSAGKSTASPVAPRRTRDFKSHRDDIAGVGIYAGLHLACLNGSVSRARRELSLGVDVNALAPGEAGGVSPLQLACSSGNDDVVRLLLAASADPNLRDRHGASALHYAAAAGHEAVVARLLDAKGCAVDPVDACGRTPLHDACDGGSGGIPMSSLIRNASRSPSPPTLVRGLLERSGDDDRFDRGNRVNIARLLIKAGADADARIVTPSGGGISAGTVNGAGSNYETAQPTRGRGRVFFARETGAAEGMTPLHLACSAGRVELASYLIRNGACFSIKDKSGCLPGDVFKPWVSRTERHVIRALLQPATEQEHLKELRATVSRLTERVLAAEEQGLAQLAQNRNLEDRLHLQEIRETDRKRQTTVLEAKLRDQCVAIEEGARRESESRKETAELRRETRHLSRGVQDLDKSPLKLREEIGELSRVVETTNVEPGVVTDLIRRLEACERLLGTRIDEVDARVNIIENKQLAALTTPSPLLPPPVCSCPGRTEALAAKVESLVGGQGTTLRRLGDLESDVSCALRSVKQSEAASSAKFDLQTQELGDLVERRVSQLRSEVDVQLTRAWQLVGRSVNNMMVGAEGLPGAASTRTSGPTDGVKVLTETTLSMQLRIGELDCEVSKWKERLKSWERTANGATVSETQASPLSQSTNRDHQHHLPTTNRNRHQRPHRCCEDSSHHDDHCCCRPRHRPPGKCSSIFSPQGDSATRSSHSADGADEMGEGDDAASPIRTTAIWYFDNGCSDSSISPNLSGALRARRRAINGKRSL